MTDHPNPDDLSLNHPRGIADQPPPVPNDYPSIQALVRLDLEAREHLGITRYGTPLQPHNGRDALVDAYQEALYLACYLRQAIAERRRTPVAASQPSAMLRAGALAGGKDLDDPDDVDDVVRRAIADPAAFKRYLDEVEEAQW